MVERRTDVADLWIEIVRQRETALDEFDPEPMGGDGAVGHDLVGGEW